MDYEKFFGLTDTPFRLTPDPDYYFPSEVHKEALQTLLYSIRANEGFIQITGDPGTGKTVTLRTFLQQMGDDVDTALVLNPRLSPRELLKVILEDLGFGTVEPGEHDKEALLRFFRDALIEKAKYNIPTVVIVDEAQNLPNETLEELRLLSNLETDKRKLLQIVLVGQVELDDKLASPELDQLAQRITIRYRLDPLSKEDTFAYIRHRLTVAGGSENTRFSPKVLNEIYKASGGVPRLINIICERSLMAAFVDGKNVIEKAHFQKALGSIVGEYQARDSRVRHHFLTGLVIFISLVLGVGLVFLIAKFVDFNGLFSSKSEPPVKETVVSATTTTTLPVVLPNPPPGAQNNSLIPEKLFSDTQDTPVTASSGSVAFVEQGASPSSDPTASPPVEAFDIPEGEVFLAMNRSQQLARLWQGSDKAPVLRAEYLWHDPPAGGLYVLSKDRQNQVHLFRYPPVAGELSLPDSADWDPIRTMLDKQVIPLLVMVGNNATAPEDQQRALEVETLVDGWVAAWRNKDIDGLMGYYGENFESYTIGRSAAKIYTKEDLKQAKQDVFEKSGAINVELTAPVLVLDPSDPTRVMAAFFQRYESSVYSDTGTKVLYFTLVEEPGGKASWRIAAQLWIPIIGG